MKGSDKLSAYAKITLNPFGSIIHADAIEYLKTIDNNSIDLIVTDPPYKCISGGKNGKKGRPSGILSKNDGKIFKHNDVKPEIWFPELYRVLKEGSHCYIMTNTLNLREYLNLAEKVGFKLHNLLVWEKNNKVTNRWYMKNGEYVLFLRKGPAKPINDCSCATIHQFDNVRKKEHPTEKPVSLLKMYVTNSSQEGDTVLDPFCGSGSLAEACLLSDRKFVCIDIDEEFYQKTTNRVLTCIKQLPDEMRYKYERSTEKHCENHEKDIFWFD